MHAGLHCTPEWATVHTHQQCTLHEGGVVQVRWGTTDCSLLSALPKTHFSALHANSLHPLEMDNKAALATNTRCAVATACTDHKLRAASRFLIANS